MTHDLSIRAFDLPDVDEFLAGDSREFAFTVVDANGDGVDISGAAVEWRLFGRAYQTGDSAAVLTGDDSSVEIVTDNRVDTSAGEFEVRLDPDATVEEWGSYWHRPRVIQSDGSEASWLGEIVLTA